MPARIRIALGIALLLASLAPSVAMAKGSFAFVTISGASLGRELQLTDPKLTSDFFAFAEFFSSRAAPPGDAGSGYEITRYYLDRGRRQAFDRLHYYPATGYVYYDGIVNGWSEYDGNWYRARPEMRSNFEHAVRVGRLLELLRHLVFIRRG